MTSGQSLPAVSLGLLAIVLWAFAGWAVRRRRDRRRSSPAVPDSTGLWQALADAPTHERSFSIRIRMVTLQLPARPASR